MGSAKTLAPQSKTDSAKTQAHQSAAGSTKTQAPSTTPRVFGYARVSAKDQNLTRQLDALYTFPVPRKNIYTEKASGKNFERPSYKALMNKLRAGDTLVVKSIDRLGRNYDEILNEWRKITKEKKCFIVVLDMPLLDTRATHSDVTGVFIVDIVLQLLSYVAQVERDNTKQRQAEGIAAARARGVKFGRPPKKRPRNYKMVKQAYVAGAMTKVEAAARLKVCTLTFEKWLKQDAEESAGGASIMH
jgi:DNA invertase Pin-like site-specific DNA recombinase